MNQNIILWHFGTVSQEHSLSSVNSEIFARILFFAISAKIHIYDDNIRE